MTRSALCPLKFYVFLQPTASRPKELDPVIMLGLCLFYTVYYFCFSWFPWSSKSELCVLITEYSYGASLLDLIPFYLETNTLSFIVFMLVPVVSIHLHTIML